MDKTEKALREIKAVLDTNFEPNWINYGALQIQKKSFTDSHGKTRVAVEVESGSYDHNYGGRVTVEASPTGKVLTVFVSDEIKVVRENGE